MTTTAKTMNANATMNKTLSRPAKRRLGWTSLLLAGALVTLGAGTAHARCYTPSEQTAGWKRAAIPDDAPGLAVTELGASSSRNTVDQFRADEPTVVWHSSDRGSVALTSHHLGRTEYLFRVDGVQWQLLRFQLAAGLAGEKVDVIAYTPGGLVPIWLERRVSGNEIAVEWSLPGVYAVAVSFHQHLRERPVVTWWQPGLRTTVSSASWLSEAFRQPRSLYYYHPGGQTVILCDLPGRELDVRRVMLNGSSVPSDVRLLPR